MTQNSPIGSSAQQGSSRRAAKSAAYRDQVQRLAPYEAVARELIKIRLDAGLTQEALAQQMGTTSSAISRLESGHVSTSISTLMKVANACGRQLHISFTPLDTPSVQGRTPRTAQSKKTAK